MRARLRRLAWRLVDILSSLEIPQKTGLESGCCNPSWPEPDQLKRAIHYLTVSARYFRLGGIFLRHAASLCASSMLTVAKSLTLRGWHLFYGFRQSEEQISHCSCPKSDAKKEVLSNAKNVDAPDALQDPINPCKKPSKPQSCWRKFVGDGFRL